MLYTRKFSESFAIIQIFVLEKLKLQITPRQGGFLVGALARMGWLAEADAGYVGIFDGGGVVGLVGAEGEGEVLDFVLFAG